MKHVNVYEINRQSKTVAPSCSEVEFYSSPMFLRSDAENWGNPPGTEKMVRHRQRIIQVREEGGRDNYIACGPDLQRLLECWSDHAVLEELKAKRAEVERLELDAKRRTEHCEDVFRRFDRTRDALSHLDAAHRELEASVRNFLQANMITRVWRAIVGRL
jgi:hypothetical protein